MIHLDRLFGACRKAYTDSMFRCRRLWCFPKRKQNLDHCPQWLIIATPLGSYYEGSLSIISPSEKGSVRIKTSDMVKVVTEGT
ncbi:hypothetical protein AVEN_264799-1 [Araneus ventricosus]|uniref:Uncharacterized protein n=1 Tax=Araneus ventricosus TaxID=182803 RepID=A0A4Y2TUT4_ARAVE|nr:hypothetical protein AVEN_264799-1 [Araneus ventricosus]